jgi:predicted neuraminidase
MMKLTALSLLVVAMASLSEAFMPHTSLMVHKNKNTPTPALFAVTEKGQLTAPSKASDDETSAIYDKNVQTTYG